MGGRASKPPILACKHKDNLKYGYLKYVQEEEIHKEVTWAEYRTDDYPVYFATCCTCGRRSSPKGGVYCKDVIELHRQHMTIYHSWGQTQLIETPTQIYMNIDGTIRIYFRSTRSKYFSYEWPVDIIKKTDLLLVISPFLISDVSNIIAEYAKEYGFEPQGIKFSF